MRVIYVNVVWPCILAGALLVSSTSVRLVCPAFQSDNLYFQGRKSPLQVSFYPYVCEM